MPPITHPYNTDLMMKRTIDIFRLAQTARHPMKRYELDTIGHLYASTISDKYTPIFRLQANLHDAVDAALLQRAVDDLRVRYPYLYVGLKKGVFSSHLEESDEQLKAVFEQASPLQMMSHEEVGHFCMRILYGERYIAIEVVHVLTDGCGARLFLTALLRRYLELQGRLRGEESLAHPAKEVPLEEEVEDAYARHAGQVMRRPKGEKVFRPVCTFVDGNRKTMTVVTIPSEQLLEKAHGYGVTVTTLLTTVLTDTLIEMQDRMAAGGLKRRIAVGLAVDARNILGSQTMRNFSVETSLGLAPAQTGLSFEEKCLEIDRQLKERTKKAYIQTLVSEYVAGMRNPVVRCIPSVIKDRLIDYLYAKKSVEGACTCLSNLGNMNLPEDMSPYIGNVYFSMGAERILPANCCVVSFMGSTNICFTRTIEESAIEDGFIRRLEEMGMKIGYGYD